MPLFALSDCVPTALERLLACPGGIDGRPTDMADIIVLLQRGNLLCGVGRIALSTSDPGLPGYEVRDQEEAGERHVARPRQCGKCVAFEIAGEYTVDDRRMALGQHMSGLLGGHVVDPLRELRRICGWRQPLRLADPEHPLAN